MGENRPASQRRRYGVHDSKSTRVTIALDCREVRSSARWQVRRPTRMDPEAVTALAALELLSSMHQCPAVGPLDMSPGLQGLEWCGVDPLKTPENESLSHLSQATRSTPHVLFPQQLSNYLRQGPRVRARGTLSAESHNAL